MGWTGHKIYDGDGTKTWHYDFLIAAKVFMNEDDAEQYVVTDLHTRIPVDKQKILAKNYKKILEIMPNIHKHTITYAMRYKYADYDDVAIAWQMLLALFLDNKLPVPKEILDNGIEATQHLMKEHAEDFDYPSKRKKCLSSFVAKAKKAKVIK